MGFQTTVATFGRLVDRFANGRLSNCLSVLEDYASYPELAAAFDVDTVQDVSCAECSARQQLVEELAGEREEPAEEGEEPCRWCRELREARRNYNKLRARFISYYFWPAMMDSQKIPVAVELYSDPSKQKPKSHYRRKKQRNPWVKKWEVRKHVQAMAASCPGNPPPEDDVLGMSRAVSTGDVAGASGTQRMPHNEEETDSMSD